jgi:transposase
VSKVFRPYQPEQTLLLPPSLRDWLAEDHLALFVSDVVDTLDLKEITSCYESGDGRGYPPHDPRMMVKLLVYGYCVGKRSSRKLERATWDEVPFRVLSGDTHPDHDCIATFRKRHLKALSALFLQVLQLCRKAGLAKLGHVAIDGTKVKANASKHKAMSYDRMQKTEKELEAQITELLAEAERLDDAEDEQHGKGRRGDELPAELQRRESRLAKIKEAKAALEAEAKARADKQREEIEQKRREREKRPPQKRGRDYADPKTEPDPKAQRNFTDPESRIMVGGTKEFVQAYNVQNAVNEHQIILATEVSNVAPDQQKLVPMVHAVKTNLGEFPAIVSADAGYHSEAALSDATIAEVDLYVPKKREQCGKTNESCVPLPPNAKASERMQAKLATPAGRAVYARRKAIVEPVFGQVKEARGIRAFLLRGLDAVRGEWNLIALTHNLLKLFRLRGPLALQAAT